MLFKKKKDRLRLQALKDIRENILLARSFVAGTDFESFSRDKTRNYAAVRALEIISEASRRLPDEMKARHPNIPWRDIATAGNFYRHEYHRLHDREIWGAIHGGLSALLEAVEKELSLSVAP